MESSDTIALSDAISSHDVSHVGENTYDVGSRMIAGTNTFVPNSTSHPLGYVNGKSGMATSLIAAGEEHLSTLENLLLRGNREDALAFATANGLWPIALIIAGVCGKEAYQDVVRRYADASFGPHGSERLPLHLMCLLYSNQAEGTLKYGGKSLSGSAGTQVFQPSTATNNLPSSPSPTPITSDRGCWLLHDWKRIVASIIANKSGHWSSLLRLLAERLRKEKQVMLNTSFTCRNADVQ